MGKEHFINVYYANVIPLNDGDYAEKLKKTLSKDRQDKINRLNFDEDKRLSLGAGLLFNRAFSDLNVKDAQAFVYTDKNGKPRFKGEYFFSLSHSKDIVMCVVSDCEVGCDVQFCAKNPPKVSRKIFSDNEIQSMEKLGDKEGFYTFWGIKESYFKMTGEGIFSYPLSVSVQAKKGKVSLNAEKQVAVFAKIVDDYVFCWCVDCETEKLKINVIKAEL